MATTMIGQSPKAQKLETGSEVTVVPPEVQEVGGSLQREETEGEKERRPGSGDREGVLEREGEVQAEAGGERQPDQVDLGLAAVAHLSKKKSGEKNQFNTLAHQKKRKHKRIPEYATQHKGVFKTKSRTTLRSGFFSQVQYEKPQSPEERSQLAVLQNRLSSFSIQGLPQLPGEVRDHWEIKVGDETTIKLEESWTNIVSNHMMMSKKERHQQEALWELIHTELSYMKRLRVITDLVIAGLLNLHLSGHLLEVRPELLFSNIPDIIRSHRAFWQEVMSPMLQEVRLTGKPFDPMWLQHGFLTFSERFHPYLKYCLEEENMTEFARSQIESNPRFHMFMSWVESHRLAVRMRLGDMQAKPHQRITKYPLLLQAILKRTEHAHTRLAVQRMLDSVSSFLDSVNCYLQSMDEQSSLYETASRIEGYDLLERISEDVERQVREFCQIDLTRPMKGVGPTHIRKLLLEETLKIKEKKDSKVEVVALLFSDVLLLTKRQRKSNRLRVTRPPLAIEHAHCRPLRDTNSFLLLELCDLGCAVAVYTVYTPTADSCARWISAVDLAQHSLAEMRKRETFRWLQDHTAKKPDQQEALVTHGNAVQSSEDEKEEEIEAKKHRGEPTGQSETGDFASSGRNQSLDNGGSQLKNGRTFLPSKRVEMTSGSQLGSEKVLSTDMHTKTGNNSISLEARNVLLPNMPLSLEWSQWEHNSLLMSRGITRTGSERNLWEDTEIVFPYGKERRVTWKHSETKHDLSPFSKLNTEEASNQSIGNDPLLLGRTMDNSALQSGSGDNQLLDRIPVTVTSVSQSEASNFTGDTPGSQSGDEDLRAQSKITESWTFSRKLVSPQLRRRRPLISQRRPSRPTTQTSDVQRHTASRKTEYLFLRAALGVPDSNSDSDSMSQWGGSPGLSTKKPVPNTQRQILPRMETFSQIEKEGTENETEVSGNGPVRISKVVPGGEKGDPDNGNNQISAPSQQTPCFKTQRSASSSDLPVQAAPGPYFNFSWTSDDDISFSVKELSISDPLDFGSAKPKRTLSLEDILERARTREREREGGKGEDGRERGRKDGQREGREPGDWDCPLSASPYPPSSPSSSLSPSDGEGVDGEETEGEELVFVQGSPLGGDPARGHEKEEGSEGGSVGRGGSGVRKRERGMRAEQQQAEKSRCFPEETQTAERDSDLPVCDEAVGKLVADGNRGGDQARKGRRMTLMELQRIRSLDGYSTEV
ncbi:uncharacterized protein plekhg6 isoform X2 [Lepisosteus oculatus]|uniref:uncharacterized protein plekhg6 isoform X2 n=1 Tax=Lepisosteus oculatus TaxID=7918 RepID=UPI0035F51B21